VLETAIPWLSGPSGTAVVNLIQIVGGVAIVLGWLTPRITSFLAGFSEGLKSVRLRRLKRELIEFENYSGHIESMLVAFSFETSIIVRSMITYILSLSFFIFAIFMETDLYIFKFFMTLLMVGIVFILSVKTSFVYSRYARWERALLDPRSEVELIKTQIEKLEQ
jgi:hypothetical protein